MSIFSKLFHKDQQTNLSQDIQDDQDEEKMSQTGKSYDEMALYLMSGESDDFSTEYTNKI